MRKLLSLFCLVIGLLACEDILEVPDISDQQVQILAPVNGSVLNQSTVRLSWDSVGDAEGYVVQVARPNFENAAQFVVDTTLAIDTTYVGTRLNVNLTNDSYEWRVKAFNSGFETQFSRSGFQVNQ
ncbi:MAG: fibronectin type III domain-containing protein [Flavobacteriaceae bacterium]